MGGAGKGDRPRPARAAPARAPLACAALAWATLAWATLAWATLAWADHSAATTVPAAPSTATIVLLRHGEKPAAGLGQLTCQGLNRALALPDVIAALFGRPDAIFAPDPAQRKKDGGIAYDYVRPLATVEPAAIRFGLPVDTRFGYRDVAGLQAALETPRLAAATIVVGWEHTRLVVLARALLAGNGGDPRLVPDWPADDFDSLYVLRIARGGPSPGVTFEHRRQGLDGQPATCPGG